MKIITIMADWGPHAWLKECEDGTTRVGGSIADAYGFQSSGFWVSPGLEQAFADWIDDFGWRCFDAEPGWPSFHLRGIELSRRLKAEIGDQARVIYCKASEDPESTHTRRTEILADGTLKPIPER